jgi:hypothetical protein
MKEIIAESGQYASWAYRRRFGRAYEHSSFSGTRWRIHTQANNVWILECLGEAQGPRFLDGHTADASVHLAPHTNAPFSGTRWLRTDLSDGNFTTLRCMGTGLGDRRFLDGNTGQATVAMAPNAELPFTGTHWKLEIPFGDDNVAVPASG